MIIISQYEGVSIAYDLLGMTNGFLKFKFHKYVTD